MALALALGVAPASATPTALEGDWSALEAESPGTTRWERPLPLDGGDAALFVPGGHRLGAGWEVAVDGTPLAAAGDVSEGTTGGHAGAVVPLPAAPGEHTLTVTLLGGDGPPAGLVVGTPTEARVWYDADESPRLRRDVLDGFAAGFYLFTALYHLQLHRRRRSTTAYLWFSLVCLGALAVDATGMIQRHVLTGLPTVLGIANGLAAGGTLVAMLAFGAALVDRPTTRLERAWMAALAASGVVYGLGVGGGWTVPFELPTAMVWLAGLGLFVVGVVRAAWRGHPEARLLATGFAAFAVLLGLGIAAQAGVLPGAPRWLPIPAFVVLILSMALSLADRFERAHRELDALREDLERRVEARTAELADANARLEGFNRELADRVREQVGEIVKNRRLWRYFPRAVVQRLLDDDDAQVRTERARLTVMFTDLTGFTTFSDGADPEAVTATLNAYLEEMVGIVEAHGGVVDKVMGDGIMAIWGAPEAMDAATQARRAVAAGVEMQARMGDLTAGWRARGIAHPFRIRIGVHQDLVAVGSIGSEALRSFTAIGSGVNLASRLEGACPPGSLLVSREVARHIGDTFSCIGPVPRALKGLREPVETWEVRGAGVVG